MRVARTAPLFTAALLAAFVASASTSSAVALDRACREKPTSACVLEAAAQLAQGLPQDSSMMGGGTLASAWALLGQVDRAITAAGNDKNPNASLRLVAKTLAKAGRFDSALQVARAVPWPKWKSAALLEIAEAALEAGQSDLAGSVVEEARRLEVTSPLNDPFDRSPSIAGLLTRVGRLDQALEVARDMSFPVERLVELQSVAKVLAEMGRVDEASRIAGDMQNPDYKSHALIDIAGAHARAKGSVPTDRLFEAAWQASLETSRTFEMRGLVQERIVAAMAAAGRLDRAEALAARISDAPWRGGALAKIGEAYLVAGQATQARRILDLAKNVAHEVESGPSSVLSDVARAMARGGAFEEAEQLATSIPDASFRTVTLQLIANQLAVKNQMRHATRIIADLPTEYRAAATRRVLLALATTGARERRMAMVSEALELAMKPWPGVNTRSPRGRIEDTELRVVTLISIGRSLAEAGL